MLKIYLKISIKVTYLNYLTYAQQTISMTTLMSKYPFLKILKKRVFPYVNMSRHVNDKILRLQWKVLAIEKAKTKAKKYQWSE